MNICDLKITARNWFLLDRAARLPDYRNQLDATRLDPRDQGRKHAAKLGGWKLFRSNLY